MLHHNQLLLRIIPNSHLSLRAAHTSSSLNSERRWRSIWVNVCYSGEPLSGSLTAIWQGAIWYHTERDILAFDTFTSNYVTWLQSALCSQLISSMSCKWNTLFRQSGIKKEPSFFRQIYPGVSCICRYPYLLNRWQDFQESNINSNSCLEITRKLGVNVSDLCKTSWRNIYNKLFNIKKKNQGQVCQTGSSNRWQFWTTVLKDDMECSVPWCVHQGVLLLCHCSSFQVYPHLISIVKIRSKMPGVTRAALT